MFNQSHWQILVLNLFLACTAIGAADEKQKDSEANRPQGRFERTVNNAAGTPFQMIQEFSGDTSTVIVYDDVGNLVQSHTATFKTEKRGPVRVLSFYNLVVTAGPNKGASDPATHSYIYRYDGKQFAEVWGVLEGDESPPRIAIWQRIEEKDKPQAKSKP